MANEILEQLAKDIPKIDEQIKQAEEVISAMQEVGTSVVEQRSTLNKLKQDREKYYKMLQKRGYIK